MPTNRSNPINEPRSMKWVDTVLERLRNGLQRSGCAATFARLKNLEKNMTKNDSDYPVRWRLWNGGSGWKVREENMKIMRSNGFVATENPVIIIVSLFDHNYDEGIRAALPQTFFDLGIKELGLAYTFPCWQAR
ncbi:unnamed protein product [Zymoseptoria tritici ST99CH_1A5]|uniref:Uncharacterized protein n=2 Tax=Zymoseptoria tritici TaxID=1047171 RepID=A0A2H1FP66_ZYMTR|nr:unnamed protein product [Zymoseptoria tritici ST99CH_1E4]SMY20348.1 unnamed protein product [Zymoseptoria tritici ST99CH_1A5]